MALVVSEQVVGQQLQQLEPHHLRRILEHLEQRAELAVGAEVHPRENCTGIKRDPGADARTNHQRLALGRPSARALQRSSGLRRIPGGVRVPGLIEWPARIRKPFASNVPVVTSDIYPTIVDLLNIDISDKTQPIDGISILPLLDGKMEKRPKGIGFWHPEGDDILSTTRVAWLDNQYKLYKLGEDEFELYDLNADASEKMDVAAGHPDVVKRMKADMEAWQQSVTRSFRGKDYPDRRVVQPGDPKGE